MNKVLRVAFSFIAVIAVAFAYAFISHEMKAFQTDDPTDAVFNGVAFNLNNGSVNVALVDVYETIGDGEAVEMTAYRVGGSKKGKLVLTVPAGTSALTFTVAMPKGTPDQNLFVTVGDAVETLAVKANDGITGYAPYKVAFADAAAKAASTFTVRFPANEEGDTDLTFELETSNRFILWDVFLGDGSVVLESGKYFFKNLATGKFWGAANDWGTHASLVDNPEFMTLEKLEDGTYTLETNVNNGGTQYYFNGDWMDNGSPVHLTIVDHLGYFTISNGDVYYGYNGQNSKIGNDSNTSTDPEDDNVKWQIVSEAEAAAYLAAATADEPVNATFYIKNANFGRNNRMGGGSNNDLGNAWTGSGVNNWSGGANENMCAESYHQVFSLSQTIEGVPNGVYGLVAQGFFRVDDGASEARPVIFLNDDMVTFPERTGTENSMTDASNSFLVGKYLTDMAVVEVTDGTITLGAKLEDNTALWCIWDNFTLYYYGTEAAVDVVKFAALQEQLNGLVAQAAALNCEGLPAAYADALTAALASAEAPSTTEEYKAAIDALATAVSSVNTAKNAKAALAAMQAEMDATNVYTAEAYEAYKAIYDNGLAQYEAGTPVAVGNPQIVGGWHAANDIDDLLLSAWTINDVQCKDYNTSLYINTWSVEGDSDGSNFHVPFFEYWTGDDQSLSAATLTATVPDLEAGNYTVTLWARVRIKNGGEAPTYGITMDVNDGEAVDLCAGELVPNSPFYLAEFTANGVVGQDGVLKINIKVAEDNNVSWLSFKNVTYVANIDPVQKAYQNALAALEDGKTYRISTDYENSKYYLTETGTLTDNAQLAATFTFKKVAGVAYEYGFLVDGGNNRFSNPRSTDVASFTEGKLNTSTASRSDWDAQVFFLNDGKYAVRSTNAAGGESGWAYVGMAYWTVNEGPVAEYSFDMNYIWNVEEYVDARPAAMATINSWMTKLQQYTGLVQDATQYSSNAAEPSEGSLAGLLDGDYDTFFHTMWSGTGPDEDHYLQAELAEPVSEFYFFFKKRSQNNKDRATEIDITAGDDELFGLDEVATITEGLPTDANVISYISEKITMDAPAKLIRFSVPSTNDANGANNGHPWFTFSEFYILPASDLLTEIIESGYLDVTSYTELTEEDIEKIEAIDKKFEPLEAQQAYKDAMAVLKDGETYRVTTDYQGTKYYLTSTGYLTDDEDAAATFKFMKVAGDQYEYGFKLASSYFTNPPVGGNPTLNNGHIDTNSSARNTWEAQVFFLKDGKYAVRATNAANGEGWNLNGMTFWTVNAGEEGPLAEYSFDMNYVWNVEEFVDNRLAAYDMIKTWNKRMGLVKDASKFTSNAVETQEGSLANLLDGEYGTFFHSTWSATGPEDDHYLQAEIENPVNGFYLFFMKRHNNNANRPTIIDITAGDDEAFGFDLVANLTEDNGLPTDESTIYFFSKPIYMSGAYKFVRFSVPETNSSQTGNGMNNGHPFFTFSEFNLFPVHPTVLEVMESGYMLLTSASQVTFADVPVIEELDKKIDEMNAAGVNVDPMVDGVISIADANNAKTIFDLSGRRVVKTTKGVFIVNGKKVVK